MGVRYVPRTEAEVRERLESAGFRQVWFDGVRELVFEHLTANSDVRVRVYTSVAMGEDGSATRRVGEDAGRVVLVATGSNRPVWKSKRVHRTKGFLDNLLERCREAYRAASSLKKCPECLGYMVERRGRNGKFLGCLRYPECRGTREV